MRSSAPDAPVRRRVFSSGDSRPRIDLDKTISQFGDVNNAVKSKIKWPRLALLFLTFSANHLQDLQLHGLDILLLKLEDPIGRILCLFPIL